MIRRVGVIGAGVMGAGIAAHVANAGVPVVLLDLVPGAAARAVETMLKADPAPFMHRRNARLVEPGDLAADIGKLADCDWIIEAIIERPDAKRALYAQSGGGAQGRLDRFFQHLDHSAGGADRRAGRALRR